MQGRARSPSQHPTPPHPPSLNTFPCINKPCRCRNAWGPALSLLLESSLLIRGLLGVLHPHTLPPPNGLTRWTGRHICSPQRLRSAHRTQARRNKRVLCRQCGENVRVKIIGHESLCSACKRVKLVCIHIKMNTSEKGL